MANTNFAKLPALSNKVFKEWYPKTVLVQSCANDYEGEFDLDKREIDIPIYYDLSVHQTTIKERDIKPANPEFIKGSTIRVTIDKGRYSHYAETNLDKFINKLSAESSETRAKLTKKWAIEAEKELGIYCAQLPTKQQIDLITLLGGDGILDKDNIFQATDILKAFVSDADMEPSEFKLFVSERFVTVARDAKMLLGSNLSADEAFRAGYVDMINDIDTRKLSIRALTTRDTSTKQVTAEWGIWKSREGIQYVVPYRNTAQYDITPDKILMGGKGYQILEYYDFFNLYPKRLYKVRIRYAGSATPPTSF